MKKTLDNPPAYLIDALENISPVEEPEQETYWTCKGDLFPGKASVQIPKGAPFGWWYAVHNSPDEAEAFAVWSSDESWQWNRNPPHQVDLGEKLSESRRRGHDGVYLVKFIDGEWTVTKTWPSDRPVGGGK